MRALTVLTCLIGCCACAWSEIAIERLPDDRFQVRWDGLLVVPPSQPAPVNHGGGPRRFFDPTTREMRQVDVRAGGDAITVYTKRRQQVFLGEPGPLQVEARDGGLVYRRAYPSSTTSWALTLTPVDGDGLDVALRVETAPDCWLSNLDLRLFALALDNPSGDSGAISSSGRTGRHDERYRTDAAWLGPVRGEVRLNYPCGPQMFVPAAVLQDRQLAMGVCLLGAHEVWRPDYGELVLKPGADGKGYTALMTTGWADTDSFGNFYRQRFDKRYRFRFARPRPVGEGGYLRLVDAKDLWRDYVAELDRRVPVAPVPAIDRSRNNIIIQNYFTAEHWMKSEANPQGWAMNRPDWQDNRWEWTIPKGADAAEIKRITGFSEADVGRPVKWIRSFAEKNLREMQETKAQAMIVWRSSISTGEIGTDYLAESHFFQPDMEERLAVDGPVKNWDWVRARARLVDENGAVLAATSAMAVHAANRAALIKHSRFEDLRQVLSFAEGDIAAAGATHAAAGAVAYEDRRRFRTALKVMVTDPAPRDRLLGLKPGDRARLQVRAQLHDGALAAKPLFLELEVQQVERAVIDVWAKTLTEAGQEIGFLVREDITVGPAWRQSWVGFDWSAEWQYAMLKQRFQWHRERFGDRCRWFYLDVFATYTPQFLLEMLRADFPDCFFFCEHPTDVAVRTLQAWNWYGGFGELELMLNPNAIATVLPDRLCTGDDARDRDILRKFWKSPNYFLCTHRMAPRLVQLMEGAGR